MPSSQPLKGERVSFGRRIRAARLAKGYSKAEAARRVGVKVQSWQQWELGKTSPRRETLPKLASVLGVSANTLLGMGFESASTSPEDAWEAMRANAARAREFVEQHGGGVRESSDAGELPRHRKALMEAYGRLRPEIRQWIRGLIETLDQIQNPQYWDYVQARQDELAKRKKEQGRIANEGESQ